MFSHRSHRARPTSRSGHTLVRFIGAVLVSALVTLSLPLGISPASAASVSAASFTGDNKTLAVDGMLYAKKQATLTLNVTTTNTAKCVEVSGAHVAKQTSSPVKTSWSFTFTAGDGDGVKDVTVNAYDNVTTTGSGKDAVTTCGNGTGTHNRMHASYILDNTGPGVSASLSPAANAAGWNNSPVTITWTGTDTGVGFTPKCDGSGNEHNPRPCTDSVSTATNGNTKTASGIDRLGNAGGGSAVIKIDTQAPTITGSRSPAQPASGWNNTPVDVTFACDDPKQGVTKDNAGFASGIKSCGGSNGSTGVVSVSTEGANQSVPGKAVDTADNESSTTVSGINIDRTPPVVAGAATTAPNGDGWYKGDVTIAWTCSDPLSGLASPCPANSTITGEGGNLGAISPSVSDRAGNSLPGTVTGIKIDRTAPNTSANAPATNWNNTSVTVVLDADDALAGVKGTYYKLNGGAEQTGTSVAISSDGIHSLDFWSVDRAGNVEPTKTVQVKIDKTKPSINHTQAPAANDNGWNNTNVKVTFICSDDGGSGIKSCTDAVTVQTEGKNQAVIGTAVDNAGNSTTDPATVSIDKTPPTITAAADRDPNAAGWYKDDVTVSFTCSDGLSGIVAGAAGCTPAKTLSQGANQSANGTATDAAGNTASASKTSINIDKTVPTLTGAAHGTPVDGWYKGDVPVVWSCSDALSGIADGACPGTSTVTGEGGALAVSASVSDKAGNIANATVSGLKIDRTAPTTRASVPAAKFGSWHAGSVQVTLGSSDNLSGVDKTHYSVNGGPVQDYGNPFSLGTTGTHTINFWSFDKAGNAEDKSAASQTVTIQIDNTQPSIEGSRSPTNGFGWNNGPVTVSFTCNDLESGLAGCAPTSETLGDEGEGQSVTGVATDNVGNSKSLTVGGINIDTTKPTLSGSPTTAANGAGWYKDNVTIGWTGNDGLSGIDPATQPADSVISGEGANLGAGPVTISDKAGNSQSSSVSGIKIDRTPPVINGGPTTSANDAGWHKDSVTVAFTCTDNLSQVAACPGTKVISTNGANQSVTSDKATDHAGNETPGKTVGGINVDGAAPKTDADIVCTNKNGWCRGTTATVNLTAGDQAGLSGVKGIHYKLNNANWAFAQGGSKDVNVPLAGNGTATVLFYGEDNAGNVETQNGVALKYDTIAPTVTHKLNPVANALDWNNSDVTVTFEANDDSDGSGVDADTVTKPVTISTETVGEIVKGEAYDKAGNHGTDSVTVRLDKTAPTITGAPTTSPNGASWYKGPVTIKFTCTDVLSGVASCPADVTLTANGQGQEVTRTATDKAGNEASTTVGNINIDASAPTVTVTGVTPGTIYTLGSVPTGGCTATDVGPSGLDGTCQFTVTGGTSSGVATFNYTATARDVAGNVTTVTGSYTVRYPVVTYSTSFWLQPINDTAHTAGATTSVFKSGSTVPAKFRILDANGKSIQTATPPQWITPAKGSATTSAVDETVYTDPATSGSNFTWNATEQLYQFNWASPKNGNGYFWRIGVKLDDGTTQAVNIGLR